MMTRFILHGGYTRIDCKNNKDFFKELLKGFNNPKVLLVYFARPKKEWNERFENDKKKLGKCRPSIANEKGFDKQIENTDVIFLSGGDTNPLLKELKKVDFKKLIKGKVVAGSSAGTYVLVEYYYNNDTDKFQSGLGILNVKAFCHFSEGKKDKLKMLKKYKENLKIYVLRDTEFIVLEEHF